MNHRPRHYPQSSTASRTTPEVTMQRRVHRSTSRYGAPRKTPLFDGELPTHAYCTLSCGFIPLISEDKEVQVRIRQEVFPAENHEGLYPEKQFLYKRPKNEPRGNMPQSLLLKKHNLSNYPGDDSTRFVAGLNIAVQMQKCYSAEKTMHAIPHPVETP